MIETLVRRLRRESFDGALILTSFHQSPLPLALLLRMAGISWVGAISEDYPGSLLDIRLVITDDLPEAERNLAVAEAAGFPADARGARLAVRRPLPDPRLLTGAGAYVVFHPGASVSARRPRPSKPSSWSRVWSAPAFGWWSPARRARQRSPRTWRAATP